MLWWHWMLLGLLLLVVEMLVPGGLFALFFALAALGLGILTGAGMAGPDWLSWVLFAFLSIASLLLFRGPMLTRLTGRAPAHSPIDTLVGEVVILLEDLSPGSVGRAELRGTGWAVHNLDTIRLPKGTRCRVRRVEGLTLWVGAETSQGDNP